VSHDGRTGWRERFFGARDRLGWWIVPMFVAVGLAGAVLAGSLAVVFASQRVDRLTRETAGARADLANAADDVREAADEAIAAIEEETTAFREQFAADLPYPDAAEVGVVHLTLETEVPDPNAPPAQPPQEPRGEEGEDDGEVAAPPPPPPATVTLRRRASGFVVARDGDSAFVATTFALLADPARTEVPLDVPVRVALAAGETTARVHSWEAGRGLLLLRAPIAGIDPMEWRPADEPLEPGDRITGIGLTPDLGAVRVGGTVAIAGSVGVVTDLPALDLLAGGPVVDSQGRVVAVGSTTYSPFSSDPVAIPVRLLCGDLLARCPD
jgi:S1-C subfamily serine protease